MNKQFVSVKFQLWDRKTYTYHWEILVEDLLRPGEKVHVETKDGRVTVEVESVNLPTPEFDTKPIIGRAE